MTVAGATYPRLRRRLRAFAEGWNDIGVQGQFYAQTLRGLADAVTRYRGEVLRLIAQMGLGVGALAIIDQQMTIGGLIAANMLASRVVQPLAQLIGLWRNVERYRDAAARLDSILAERVQRERTDVALPRPAGAVPSTHLTLPAICTG